jgi:hypothetical protein
MNSMCTEVEQQESRQECKHKEETVVFRMKIRVLRALTARYWTGMQVGFGDSDNEDEKIVQRGLPAGYWTGLQVRFGYHENDNEEDVQKALTEGFSAGMQTEFGDSGTQDEEDVHRALNSMLRDSNASTKWEQ